MYVWAAALKRRRRSLLLVMPMDHCFENFWNISDLKESAHATQAGAYFGAIILELGTYRWFWFLDTCACISRQNLQFFLGLSFIVCWFDNLIPSQIFLLDVKTWYLSFVKGEISYFGGKDHPCWGLNPQFSHVFEVLFPIGIFESLERLQFTVIFPLGGYKRRLELPLGQTRGSLQAVKREGVWCWLAWWLASGTYTSKVGDSYRFGGMLIRTNASRTRITFQW